MALARVGQGLPTPAPRTTLAGPGREPSGVAGRAQRTPARGGKTHARTPMDQALSQALPAVSGCGAGRRRGRGALFGPLVLLSGTCGQGRSQSVPSPPGILPPACRPTRGQSAAARSRLPVCNDSNGGARCGKSGTTLAVGKERGSREHAPQKVTKASGGQQTNCSCPPVLRISTATTARLW